MWHELLDARPEWCGASRRVPLAPGQPSNPYFSGSFAMRAAAIIFGT
jgi:hypothetical protein